MKKRNMIAMALTGALTVGAFAGLTGFAKNTQDTDRYTLLTAEQEETEELEEAEDTSEKKLTGVAAVAAKVMPAVVSITNKSITEVQDMYDMFPWGWGFGGYGYGFDDGYGYGYGDDSRGRSRQYESVSAGSGIIIGKTDTDLLIATNYHVVEGATELTVGFVDDEIVQAKIKGTAEDHDLAVISVALSDMKSETIDAISVVEIGNSDNLVLGEEVVAIGNALGYGQSVTHGVISAMGRHIELEGYEEITLLQTDAAINPGNSGGALLDMEGRLVGINSAKANDAVSDGVGYSIPISDVTDLLEDLMNSTQRTEKVDDSETGFIGITGQDVSSEMNQLYGIPEGIYITSVTENSPAEDAGIRKGDVIVKFDHNRVSSMQELKEKLSYYKAGEDVTLTVSKADGGEYEEEEITITLGSLADYSQIG